jgi:hypothetical protein
MRSARSGLARPFFIVTSGVLLVFAGWELSVLLPHVLEQRYALGVDFHQYQEATRRWLAGDGFYWPRQLMGAYDVQAADVLYPPTILLLLVPFLVLPEILWWAIPLGCIALVVYRLRPAAWTWPLLAFALAWPRDLALILFGNPTMWVAAAVAGGVVWGWPAAFVLLKPTLAPLALIGIGRRSWWLTAATVAILTLAFWTLAVDYIAVVRDARSGSTLLYSLPDLPIVLVPVIAWCGATALGVPAARARLRARAGAYLGRLLPRPGPSSSSAPPSPAGPQAPRP